MVLRKAVAAEAFELTEGFSANSLSYLRSIIPLTSLSLNFDTPPANLNVAMARLSWSASPGVKPAHSIATRIACS